jgi:hypothetical protein
MRTEVYSNFLGSKNNALILSLNHLYGYPLPPLFSSSWLSLSPQLIGSWLGRLCCWGSIVLIMTSLANLFEEYLLLDHFSHNNNLPPPLSPSGQSFATRSSLSLSSSLALSLPSLPHPLCQILSISLEHDDQSGDKIEALITQATSAIDLSQGNVDPNYAIDLLLANLVRSVASILRCLAT